MNSSEPESHSLVHALRRMGQVDEGPIPRRIPLGGGVSSLIVLAETARGLLCVKQALPRLKVAQVWHATVERNRTEVAWLRLAAQVAADRMPGRDAPPQGAGVGVAMTGAWE